MYFFRERGREGEREGEKHQCVVSSCVPPTGYLDHNPGLCPHCESNRQPFGSQDGTQCIEPHQPGLICFNFLKTDLTFRSNFRFTVKLRGKYRDFPYLPSPDMCTASPIIRIPHQVVYLLQLTHYHHPTSIVYIGVHSWCCIFCGFGQM